MLPDHADFVIGVDTHKDTHTAVVVGASGAVLSTVTFVAARRGYQEVLALANREAPGRRLWALEGSGSFGAGLATHLQTRGEKVVEIDRPKRPARRNGSKSDELDAERAAREVFSRKHLANPRLRGDREAMRVLVSTRDGAVTARTRAMNHLQELVVNAPEDLRQELRPLATMELARRCSRMRLSSTQDTEHRATVMALRSASRRVLTLGEEAAELESELETIVSRVAPRLLKEFGVGVVTAAQILCAWSHPGRVRSEAAFASLAGAAPIPASSGQTVRYRLNRGGDRQLNRALHTAVLSRLQRHPETRAYAARRTEEGKTLREIKRCLKRHLARRIYKLLESGDAGLAA
jgi:transposase